MKILGIDPGITNTGFGVVDGGSSRLYALDGGVIRTPADDPIESRLAQIAERIEQLLEQHRPDALAVESIYFGKNVQSAFAVGQARGVVLCEAGRRDLPVGSYTPQQIKRAVCGSGSADKQQVQRMICQLLDLPGPPPPDHAADALAVAVCHVNAVPLARAIEGAA